MDYNSSITDKGILQLGEIPFLQYLMINTEGFDRNSTTIQKLIKVIKELHKKYHIVILLFMTAVFML
jgi:hypothetical protein